MKKTPRFSKHNNKEEQESNSFIRFSGLAFEMLAFIILGVYGGVKVDEYMQTEKSYFTIFGSLMGCIFAMLYVIRKIPKG